MRSRAIPLFAIAALAASAMYALGALADAFSAPEGVPRLVPFRGHLEAAGAPVTVPVIAGYALFDSPTGGSQLWPPAGAREMHSVTPSGGDFTVMLGSSVPLPASIFAAGDAYVEASIGTTTPPFRSGSVSRAIWRVESRIPRNAK